MCNMMITAHGAAPARLEARMANEGITPEPNRLSEQLRQESETIVGELEERSEDVDAYYLNTQVAVHQKALDALEDALIPTAEDEELKAEPELTRAEVAEHLEEARQVRDELTD